MAVTGIRFRPNLSGIKDLAKSQDMDENVSATAEVVAENVRRQDIYVEHEPGDIALPVVVAADSIATTSAALVTIAHPSGEAVQAKHGALTKAAAEAGLDVRGG